MQTTTPDRPNGAATQAAIPFATPAPPQRLLSATIIHMPDGNRECPLESLQDLIASLSEHGQLVEVIVYPHPTIPGQWLAADGNRRVTALRFLNRDVRVRVLDKAPTEAELIALRLTIDSTRKAMDKADIAADIWKWLEITGATQDAAAETFRFSPGYISKLLGPLRRGIEPLTAMLKAGKISGTACALVAALTPEQQRKAVEEMKDDLTKQEAAATAEGRKIKPFIKRLKAENICNRLRGKKEKGPRQTKFTCCGVSGTIKGNPLEAFKALHAKLAEVFKRIERDPALVEVLPSLLK